MTPQLFADIESMLLNYKEADALAREAMLLDQIALLNKMPEKVTTKEQALEAYTNMSYAATLINYADVLNRMENQGFFEILPDFYGMLFEGEFAPLANLFEFGKKETHENQMRLKCSIKTVKPADWQLFKKLQIEHVKILDAKAIEKAKKDGKDDAAIAKMKKKSDIFDFSKFNPEDPTTLTDINTLCPLLAQMGGKIKNEAVDRLHANSKGEYRLAKFGTFYKLMGGGMVAINDAPGIENLQRKMLLEHFEEEHANLAQKATEHYDQLTNDVFIAAMNDVLGTEQAKTIPDDLNQNITAIVQANGANSDRLQNIIKEIDLQIVAAKKAKIGLDSKVIELQVFVDSLALATAEADADAAKLQELQVISDQAWKHAEAMIAEASVANTVYEAMAAKAKTDNTINLDEVTAELTAATKKAEDAGKLAGQADEARDKLMAELAAKKDAVKIKADAIVAIAVEAFKQTTEAQKEVDEASDEFNQAKALQQQNVEGLTEAENQKLVVVQGKSALLEGKTKAEQTIADATQAKVAAEQAKVKAEQDKVAATEAMAKALEVKAAAEKLKEEALAANPNNNNIQPDVQLANITEAEAKIAASQLGVEKEQGLLNQAQLAVDEAQINIDDAQTKIDLAKQTIDTANVELANIEVAHPNIVKAITTLNEAAPKLAEDVVTAANKLEQARVKLKTAEEKSNLTKGEVLKADPLRYGNEIKNDFDTAAAAQLKNQRELKAMVELRAIAQVKPFEETDLFKKAFDYVKANSVMVDIRQYLDLRLLSSQQLSHTFLMHGQPLEEWLKPHFKPGFECELGDDISGSQIERLTLLQALTNFKNIKFSHILSILANQQACMKNDTLVFDKVWNDEHYKQAKETLIKEAHNQFVRNAQFIPAASLWKQANESLSKAMEDLSKPKQEKIRKEVDILHNKLISTELTPEQKLAAYADFKKNCEKILDKNEAKALNAILTVLAVVVAVVLAAVIGFGIGFIAGAWTGPGAFFSAVAAGSAAAISVVAATGATGVLVGTLVGLGLFKKKPKVADEKLAVEKYILDRQEISQLPEVSDADLELHKLQQQQLEDAPSMSM